MIIDNLLSPAVLFFVLGLFAAIVKSDLKFPSALSESLSIYLLAAIGIKGGIELSKHSFADLIYPLLGAVLLGIIIPLAVFTICKWMKFNLENAAALAAAYGSVSIVTFGAGMAFLDMAGVPFESYMTALVVVMESPAIFVALVLYNLGKNKITKESDANETNVKMTSTLQSNQRPPYALGIVASNMSVNFASIIKAFFTGQYGQILKESFFGKSILLMLGAMTVGVITGKEAIPVVQPLFIDLYPSILMVFLLGMGLVAGERIGELRKAGFKPLLIATLGPLLFGSLGVVIGVLCGLSTGGATLLGILGASASYIAAPAAIKHSIPDANPAIYLGMSLGLTFPFNLIIGIPIYLEIAKWLQ